MPEVGVYILLSSFAAEKGKNKRKPRRDPGVELLVPCLPSCQTRLCGQGEGRKNRDGENQQDQEE